MSKCKCDLRTKLVGDGCRYCNPQDYIDHLHDALDAREWEGLTDEELKPLCAENHIIFGAYTVDFVRAIEAKLREKNA